MEEEKEVKVKTREWCDTCPSCGSPTVRKDHHKHVYIFKCSNKNCIVTLYQPKDYEDDTTKK